MKPANGTETFGQGRAFSHLRLHPKDQVDLEWRFLYAEHEEVTIKAQSYERDVAGRGPIAELEESMRLSETGDARTDNAFRAIRRRRIIDATLDRMTAKAQRILQRWAMVSAVHYEPAVTREFRQHAGVALLPWGTTPLLETWAERREKCVYCDVAARLAVGPCNGLATVLALEADQRERLAMTNAHRLAVSAAKDDAIGPLHKFATLTHACRVTRAAERAPIDTSARTVVADVMAQAEALLVYAVREWNQAKPAHRRVA